jgi:prepilin-type N-terminal cleavage/methylation domain-containing protein
MLGVVMKPERGFTLVEVMVTISVLGILAALAAPSFVNTIEKTKSRKMSDFVVQLVNYAKTEALNKNKDVYMTVAGNSICISSTTSHSCDIRNDPIQIGVAVAINDADSNYELKFDKIYGLPDTISTITVRSNTSVKAISVNILGIIKVD